MNGRPKNGMFIAVPNEIKELVVDVSPNHWRVQAITLQAPGNILLIMNSYFPNDPKTSEFDTSELLTTLSAINSVMEGNEFDNIIWTGDINADFMRNTQFTSIIERFIDENSLQKSWDTFAIKFTRIFDIDGHSHTSTLDHFFWSEDIPNNIMVADVLHIASNTSDHCPIYCKININNLQAKCRIRHLPNPKACWKKATDEQKANFKVNLENDLANLEIPASIEHCHDVHCNDDNHKNDSDNLLTKIPKTIKSTSDSFIPFSGQKHNGNKSPIFNWREEIQPYKEKALFWHAIWQSAGRPINTELHRIMKRIRNVYHLYIRKNKKMAQTLKRNALLEACVSNKGDISEMIKEQRKFSGQMLLLCDDSVSIPLQIIYSNILSTSIYPDIWKLANVTPIFKKGDKQLIKNYRPISLLPICGKILEKIIFNQLYTYLHTNNLITKNQSGFRPGDSTTNQLLFLIDEIHQAFDCTQSFEVRSVFLDISKAFDKVWHEGLVFKLEQNGISGSLLKLFQNYLNDRNQRVVLNGSFSEFFSIESGVVPQGSILGPLLFLIYINNLEKNIKSNMKFFADDTMLFSIVKDPLTCASDLNHDLDVINKWAYQWKLEFNPDPLKQATEVLFSCKKNISNHPQIFFNGIAVAKVKEQKHLGLILESNLSFGKHLSEKIKKAKLNLGIIKHLSRFLPLKTLDQMYKTLVRPHLDYCDVIYHIPSKQTQLGGVLNVLMEEVEKVQYQAALAITGAWQGSSRSKLYEELGWESLSDRRWCRRILQVHKIVNNNTPFYLNKQTYVGPP